MFCSKCGSSNESNSKFCLKCGNVLSNELNNDVTNQASNDINNNQASNDINNNQVSNDINNNQVSNDINNNQISNDINNNQVSNNINNNQVSNNANNVQQMHSSTTVTKNSFMAFLMVILNIILKPFTTIKDELSKYKTFKSAAILTLIISGAATIINLFSTMFAAVREKSFDWSSGGFTTNWEFSNLKNIDYLGVVGKTLLIYIGIAFAVAAVAYIAALIVKKQVNFSRLLSITALSFIPILVGTLLLSPILGMIWDKLTMPAIFVGAIYTFIILYEGINSELALEGNMKYYVNLACISIIIIVAYYLCVELLTASITSSFNDTLNLFG